MFCSKCGNKINKNAIFCDRCGERVEIKTFNSRETEIEQTNIVNIVPTEKFNSLIQKQIHKNNFVVSACKKPIIPILIVITVAVILCVVLSMLFGGRSEDVSSEIGSLVLVYDSKNNITRVVYNNELLENYIPGDATVPRRSGLTLSPVYCESSLDRKIYAITDENSDLYIIDEKGIQFVAHYVKDFSISYNGKGLSYIDYDGNLMLFNCTKKESRKIDSANSIEDFCISPDGQCVAYYKNDNGEYIMYSYTKGKTGIIAEGVKPIAVSEYALGYFALDKSDLYYISQEGVKEKIGSCMELCFNQKNSELIYCESLSNNSKWYYFSASEGKISFFDTDTDWRTIKVLYNNNLYNSIYFRVVPCDSLKNGSIYFSKYDIVTDSYNLIMINDKCEKEESNPISFKGLNNASSGYNYSGRSYYYFKNELLVYDNCFFKNGKEEEIMAFKDIDNVYAYRVSDNGESIYYITYDGNLYYSNINSNQSIEIYRGSNFLRRLNILQDHYLLFETDANEIYITDNSGEVKKVASGYKKFFDVISEKVNNINTYDAYVSFYTSSMVYRIDDNIYILKPDGTSELIVGQ